MSVPAPTPRSGSPRRGRQAGAGDPARPVAGIGPRPALRPGTVVCGRYRLERQRADRARTSLWRATDEVLGRIVALKIIWLGAAASEGPLDAGPLDAGPLDAGPLDAGPLDAESVLGAVAAASRCADRALVRTLDADVLPDGAAVVVVTEWVDGPSLGELLREGALAPPEAVELIRTVACGLAAAAAAGVGHGRLHPDNVLVRAGVPIVTDLAVAAAVTVGVSPTPGVDARGLGALLYAALTGTWPDGAAYGLAGAPRTGATGATASTGTTGAAPRSPRQVRAGVPRAVDALVVRLLAGQGPTPALPATPGAVAEALGGVHPSPVPSAAEPAGRVLSARTRRWLIRSAALLGLLGIGGTAYLAGEAVGRVPDALRGIRPIGNPVLTQPGLHALHLAGHVRDFNPEGDGPENPDRVRLATDPGPDLSTAWTTSLYRGSPYLGGLKRGVGLLIDLGRPLPVRAVRLVLTTAGANVELRAGNTPGPDAYNLSLVASVTRSGTLVTLSPSRPTTARYWVVWFTRLPAVPGGFQEGVADLEAYS